MFLYCIYIYIYIYIYVFPVAAVLGKLVVTRTVCSGFFVLCHKKNIFFKKCPVNACSYNGTE